MDNILKSFIIGSSFPVILPFFYVVSNIPTHLRNYSYFTYTWVAPLYLGIINVLATLIGQKWGLSLRQRYLLVGPLSGLLVGWLATMFETYNYDRQEWVKYYLRIIFNHLLIFNTVIYFLEKWI